MLPAAGFPCRYVNNMQDVFHGWSRACPAVKVERLEKENLSAVGLRNQLAAMHEVMCSCPHLYMGLLHARLGRLHTLTSCIA